MTFRDLLDEVSVQGDIVLSIYDEESADEVLRVTLWDFEYGGWQRRLPEEHRELVLRAIDDGHLTYIYKNGQNELVFEVSMYMDDYTDEEDYEWQ